MDFAAFSTRLRRAWDRRAPLRATGETTAFRALNARGDDVADVTVDWFDGVAILSLYRNFSADDERAMAEAILETLSARAVYLKRRPREARVVANVAKQEVAPPEPVAGERIDELVATENALRFRIRPGQGLSVGLYLDMRDTRAWLRERVRGATVLNLFAYTCAFGIYAHAGGAARAANLDLSRRVLDWGEENLQLNGHTPERRDHIAGDTFDWLGRFAKKGERFDVVVLDPPSFSTGRGTRFSAGRDYPKLAAAAARVVAPDGMLVACSNLEELSGTRFEGMVRQGLEQAGRRGTLMQALGPSELDFPAHPSEPAALKVRVYRLS